MRRARPFIGAVAAVCFAGQAVALSCPKPDVRSSFRAASEASESYVLAVGRLSLFPGVALPPTPELGETPASYSLRAVFEGDLASLQGFADPARFDVMVEVDCAGAKCGAVPLDEEDQLFFVERRPVEGGIRNVVVEGPCPLWTLTATPAVVEGALSCLRGVACDD